MKKPLLICLVAGLVLLVGLGANFFPGWLDRSMSGVEKQEDYGTFYRLRVGLSSGGERIDFDIVVGCSVHVAHYKSGDRTLDAFQYPTTYMKRIPGGHGVMIIPPIFCDGETTDNGIVPEDFLPQVIWYEDADDWLLGIGYFSMDAYENPRSKLDFLGASVHAATAEEFKADLPRAEEENLIPQDNYMTPYRPASAEEKAAHRWDMQWRIRHFTFFPQCHGVRRFVLDEPEARAIVRKYWPEDRPKYWAIPKDSEKRTHGAAFYELFDMNERKGAKTNGRFLGHHYSPNQYKIYGLPGPSGKVKWSRATPRYSPEYYPLRKDVGAAWFSEERAKARDFDVRFELDGGANKGFLYCYEKIALTPDWYGGEMLFPDALGEIRCFVDGEPLQWPSEGCYTPPGVFFERDEILYRTVRF